MLKCQGPFLLRAAVVASRPSQSNAALGCAIAITKHQQAAGAQGRPHVSRTVAPRLSSMLETDMTKTVRRARVWSTRLQAHVWAAEVGWVVGTRLAAVTTRE
jgi:hypothetical protein